MKKSFLIPLFLICFFNITWAQINVWEPIFTNAGNIVEIYSSLTDSALVSEIESYKQSSGLNIYTQAFVRDSGILAEFVNLLSENKYEDFQPPYLIFTAEFSPPAEGNLFSVSVSLVPSSDLQHMSSVLAEISGLLNSMLHDALDPGHDRSLAQAIIDALHALFGPPEQNIFTPATVSFFPAQNQIYGFDSLQYPELSGKYEKTRINKKDYLIPWKSVETGTSDHISFKITTNTDSVYAGFTPDSVLFQLVRTGENVPVINTGLDKQLLITGPGNNNETALTAIYTDRSAPGNAKELTLGMTNVVSYEKEMRQVVLVSVNEAPVPAAATVEWELNNIYRTAVAGFTVSSISGFTVDYDLNANNLFDNTDADNSLNYTPEMKEVITAFIGRPGYAEDVYYLFFVSNPANASLSGYMPFKKQFGFIFSQDARTIAHELGHGVFRLKHTYADYPSLSSGSTENLMDYGDGTSLWKYQWDDIHDPPWILNWLEDEEDAELNMVLVDFTDITGNLATDYAATATAYFTPSCLPVVIENLTEPKFRCGYLMAFKLQGTQYVMINTKSHDFHGYYPYDEYLVLKETLSEEEKMKLTHLNPARFLTNTYYRFAIPGDQLYTNEWVFNDGQLCQFDYRWTNSSDYSGRTDIKGPVMMADPPSDAVRTQAGDCQNINFMNNEPLMTESFEYSGNSITSVTAEEMEVYVNSTVEYLGTELDRVLYDYPTDTNQLYGDNKYHILNYGCIANQEHTERYKIMEHKLEYLKEQTGIGFYVLYIGVNFMLDADQNVRNNFARDIYNKSDYLKSHPNSILLVIPYVRIEGGYGTAPKQYLMPGICDNRNHVSGDIFVQAPFSGSFDLILGVYKYINKPCRVYSAFLFADGSISYKYKNLGNQSGRSYINGVNFYMEPEFEEMKDLEKPSPVYNVYGGTGSAPTGKPEEQYALELYQFELAREDILARAAQNSEWTAIESKQFMEKYIPEYYKCYAEHQAFEFNGLREWLNLWNIMWFDGYGEDEKYMNLDDVCYDYGYMPLISPVVLGICDVLGLVPGIDQLADAAGFIFASAMGDYEQMACYSAGLLITGGGALLVKGAMRGQHLLYKGARWVLDGAGSTYRKITNKAETFAPHIQKLFKFDSPPSFTDETINALNEKIARNEITPAQVKGVMDESGDLAKRERVLGIVGDLAAQLNFKPSWLPDRIIVGNADNPKGLIGVYNKQMPDGTFISDTKNAIESIEFPQTNASNFSTTSKEGFKLLNTDNSLYLNGDQYWEEYNLPWLKKITDSKADVVVLSDKENDLLKFQLNADFSFRIVSGSRVKTGFGKEIDFMESLVVEGKYEWDALKGIYIPIP